MHTTPAHTALLVFSRSPEAEARHKQFAPANRRANLRVAHALHAHTLRVARQSGLPVVVIDEARQQGHSFGERYAHAFAQVFAMGYTAALSLGNDCPSLSAAQLQQAARQLETHEAILGPSADGGAYLIGLQAKTFNSITPGAFEALPWQQGNLYQALEGLLLSLGHPPLTQPRLHDVDRWADVQRLLNTLQEGLQKGLRPLWNTLRHTLLALLASLVRAIAHIPLSPAASPLLRTPGLRAPPHH